MIRHVWIHILADLRATNVSSVVIEFVCIPIKKILTWLILYAGISSLANAHYLT